MIYYIKNRFNSEGNATALEWSGVCQRGICYYCATIPIPSIPIAHCKDGRSCLPDGRIVISNVGILSWNYMKWMPMEIFYAITLISVTIGIVLMIIFFLVLILKTRAKVKSQ